MQHSGVSEDSTCVKSPSDRLMISDGSYLATGNTTDIDIDINADLDVDISTDWHISNIRLIRT